MNDSFVNKIYLWLIVLIPSLTMCLSSNAATHKLSKDSHYRQSVKWVQKIAKHGKNSQVANGMIENLNRAIGKRKIQCEIGASLTKTGHAYKLFWKYKKLDIMRVSKKNAIKQGIDDLSTKCTIR